MVWKFVEGLTVADVAFEARGKSLSELFEECAEALTATMVKKVSSVKPLKTKRVKLEYENPEQLLFNFLQELIFLKDAELLLFSKYQVKIKEGNENNLLKLEAVLKGEKLDARKHELLVDVKAVTWHKFKVEKTSSGWRALVVLDV